MAEESTITWSNEGREKTLIHPIDCPNRSDIRGIPLGSPVILLNVEEDGVEIQSGMWDESMRDKLIANLPDEVVAFGNSTLFYVHPRDLKEPGTPLDDLASPDEIVNTVMLDGGDVPSMIRRAVELSREGLVQNPF